MLFLDCVVFSWLVHMSDSCVCMRDVISEFNSDIEGSHALIVFLYSRCPEMIACVVCHVVRLYNVVDIVVMGTYERSLLDGSSCHEH